MTRARKRILLAVSSVAGALLILHHDDLARLFPERVDPDAWVDDRAALLSAAQRAGVAQYHAALRAAHDIDYRVLTLERAGDVNVDAYRYFEAADVGARSAGGRGLLLVVDTAADRVRLEVSTSLEGVYTDAFTAYVQNRQMVPFFRTGRVADGILATTELIVTRAQEAEAGNAFLPPMDSEARGGGATARARIGAGAPTRPEPGPAMPGLDPAGLGPLDVVALYHAAMAARDARTDSALYSAATVRMLGDRVMTPAQMDHVARTYAGCAVNGVRIRDELAVVRYGVSQRQCAPYFLRLEDAAWRLDLAAMSATIGFNHENEWHFRLPVPERYRFALDGWRLDRNGFPHAAE